MEYVYLLKAVLVGFVLAMQIGPLAILCINRTIKSGFKVGIISALGVSTVDGLYSVLSFLGLGIVINSLFLNIFWIRSIGAIYLFYLGIKIFTSHISKKHESSKKESLVKNYLSTFIITITNPLTVMSFTAVFTSIMLGENKDISIHLAILIFLAVFLGSALWHLILLYITHLLKTKISFRFLLILNKLSGTAIILFSLNILINLFKNYVF